MMSLDSLSSSFMCGITLYRNQHGITNKCLAQPGYALTFSVAIIETVAAGIFLLASLALYPLSSNPFKDSVNWLKSCSFVIYWSAADFLLNPFLHVLVADETSARKIARRCDLMRFPTEAII